MVTISNKEKWARVDAVINGVDERKKSGEPPTLLEEYVVKHFSKGTEKCQKS
jgi:hypothetical protein